MLLGSIHRRVTFADAEAICWWPSHLLLRSSVAVPRGDVVPAGVVLLVRREVGTVRQVIAWRVAPHVLLPIQGCVVDCGAGKASVPFLPSRTGGARVFRLDVLSEVLRARRVTSGVTATPPAAGVGGLALLAGRARCAALLRFTPVPVFRAWLLVPALRLAIPRAFAGGGADSSSRFRSL